MKRLITVTSHMEAEIIRGKLEANGVDAFIRADDEGGFMPGLQLTNGVDVMVDEQEFDLAQSILAQSNDG